MKYRGKGSTDSGWLLFFYSVPSKPVSNRMKIWRKLSKAGAVQIKGAVYILPMSEEHYEFFQWLVAEVSQMGGEAAFTKVEAIDSMKDHEIVNIFNAHKDTEYQVIGKSLEDIETKVNSIKKGSKSLNSKALSEQIARLSKSYGEAVKTDFFSSKTGSAILSRFNVLNATVKGFAGASPETRAVSVPSQKLDDYQGKIWVSRKRPFVDRMASAWLIRRFIDKNATFRMADEKELANSGRNEITFDVSGGMFTHAGDLCTFEVLVKAFGLKEKAVKKIAEIVHELDIKDDKYSNAESAGVEDILSGLRKAIKEDTELLEKGMSVFEMLYLSKAG